MANICLWKHKLTEIIYLILLCQQILFMIFILYNVS